jgi:hypothetical protein
VLYAPPDTFNAKGLEEGDCIAISPVGGPRRGQSRIRRAGGWRHSGAAAVVAASDDASGRRPPLRRRSLPAAAATAASSSSSESYAGGGEGTGIGATTSSESRRLLSTSGRGAVPPARGDDGILHPAIAVAVPRLYRAGWERIREELLECTIGRRGSGGDAVYSRATDPVVVLAAAAILDAEDAPQSPRDRVEG